MNESDEKCVSEEVDAIVDFCVTHNQARGWCEAEFLKSLLRAERTAREKAEKELAKCGKQNCMGYTVDGVRTWVTKQALEAAESRADRLQEALEKIIERTSGPSYMMARVIYDTALAALSPRTEAQK
jgi:Ni,Fe-hydrogenase III large subunit